MFKATSSESRDLQTHAEETQPLNVQRSSRRSPTSTAKSEGSADGSSSPARACTATFCTDTKISAPSSMRPLVANGLTTISVLKIESPAKACSPSLRRPSSATANCSRKCNYSSTGSEHVDHRLVLTYSINTPSSSNYAGA